MARVVKGNKGMSVLGVVVALTILAIGLYFFSSASNQSRRVTKEINETTYAELYATELLELFRSFETSSRLKAFFSEPARAGYLLCAHINILDRTRTLATDERRLNPDPIADLPPDNRFLQAEPWRRPNRWYQVNIINLKTMATATDRCDQTVVAAPMGADEGMMVTVGVSWYSAPEKLDADGVRRGPDLDRVVLSTILPGDFIPHRKIFRVGMSGALPDFFYSSNRGEIDNALSNGYSGEVEAFHTLTDDGTDSRLVPVYRLYNPNGGQHYLTCSAAEKASLMTAGWLFDNEEGYLFNTSVPNTQEVFHLYLASTGEHLFTVSTVERDAKLAAGWVAHTSLGFAPMP